MSRVYCVNPYLKQILEKDHVACSSSHEPNERFDFYYNIKVDGYQHRLQHYPMGDVAFIDNKIQFAKLLEKTKIKMPKTYFCLDDVPEGTQTNYFLKYAHNNGGNQVHMYNSVADMAEHLETDHRPFVIQEEVTRPLLLDNKKFVLRMWLVSFSNGYHLGKDGLFRIQLDDYDPSDVSNIDAHNQYDMEKLKFGIFGAYDFYEDTLSKIVDFMGPLTKAIDSKLTLKPNCFQIYGVDLIIDEDLQPHVIEINSWPNMNASSPEHNILQSQFFRHFYFDLVKPFLSGLPRPSSDYFIAI